MKTQLTELFVPDELLEPLLDVIRHYVHAKQKHEEFPLCNIKQGALICEETLEAIQSANDGNTENFKHEVGQVCAVSLRTLIHLQHK